MRILVPPRCLFLLIAGAIVLTACGGGATPTAPSPPTPTIAPTPTGPRPTTTPPPTIDPALVRTGSAIIPSPIGQTASIVPPTSLPPSVLNPQTSSIPTAIPLPTVTAGVVLAPLQGGGTYTTKDTKVSIRYPSDWEAQTADNAAQFVTKGASPSDPNVPRVTFNSFPIDLALLTGDNAQSYVQTLAQQTAARGSTNLTVRSIDRVRLGSPSGPEAVRVVVAYTAGVPVISEQVIVKRPDAEETYFISATAPAATFDAKWKAIIDGIAGSVTFP